METLVQVDIAREPLDRYLLARHQLVDLGEAFAEFAERRIGQPTFGAEPRGEAFERAAHLDGVIDVSLRERLHREAARGDELEQALFLQPYQRHADRGARDAETVDHRELGNAVA